MSRHGVLQRTREFGIRLALGATTGGLIRLVLGRNVPLVATAVIAAVGGTMGVTRSAFVELLALSSRDPWFWVSFVVTLGVVSTLACYLATRGLARLHPMEALRDP